MLQDKQKFLDNWNQFELNDALCETLVANNFNEPTKVQGQSLVYLQSHIDLIIAAKTGQGKTLCFGLPILDILVKKVQKFNLAQSSSSEEDEQEEAKSENSGEDKPPKARKRVFDSVKALIISPTRELAIQIRDMIDAVIPMDCQDQIKTTAIVGGMSIQKQQRLLSYKPAIVIATPGRLWELMDDIKDPYLANGLPMIDVLVLDEADRMIADGHFKELKDILNHIYKKRVDFKREALAAQKKNKENKGEKVNQFGKVGTQQMKDAIRKGQQEAVGDSKDFKVGSNLERTGKNIGAAKIIDLDEEDEMEDLMIDDQVIGVPDEHLSIADQHQRSKERKIRLEAQKKQEEENDEQFDKDYLKYGGIQHIICSATMTIDNTGRITPKQEKKNKKQNIDIKEQTSTLDALCETLKFRSKHPKVIDLTIEDGVGSMPETLQEYIVRCKSEEKDLYMYYFLQEKKGESMIIFSNAITATRRLNSLLDFLKIKNFCLHSQMQQKQRLKNLDRFKRAVNDIESGHETPGAILVCTDVASRGLDIPYVSNVVHYQCPYNAEIYVHRCGRTARIGRKGDSLNLLTPDDNKAFKQICQTLKKKEEALLRYEVKYNVLEKIKPLIDQAKKIEKTIHKKQSNEKEANWTLGMARDAELPLDEDMQHDLAEQLGQKNTAKSKDVLDDEKLFVKYHDDTPQRKRDNKAKQKENALKSKYDKEIESQKLKKFSNSSYLTPEAAVYLNEVMTSGSKEADEEVIYAGLHQQTKNKMKFKRRETYSSKYTKRRQSTRKRKGRFG